MLRIVLIVGGLRTRWEAVTGLQHPRDGCSEAILVAFAKAAVETDPQITGYSIEDDSEQEIPYDAI